MVIIHRFAFCQASTKLNVRSSDKIFRNLPDIEPAPVQKRKSVTELIEKFSGPATSKRLSKELEEEIKILLQDISEVNTNDLKLKQLPNEANFLGLTKPDSDPNLLTTTKRDEDRVFLNSLLKMNDDLKTSTDDERFQLDFNSLEGWKEYSETNFCFKFDQS